MMGLLKEFIQGDVLDELPIIEQEAPVGLRVNFNLILTDPPYNIGWKYSDKVNDNKPDYHEWCEQWVDRCIESLRENSILCIINYPENNNILFSYLKKRLNYVQQLIWCYPTNVGHSKRKYTRTYRTILVFSNGDDYTFNPQKQPYKNPTDKRIKQRIAEGHEGTNHYDIFNINLCKNGSKSKKQNGINQLPNDLVDMLIKTYTNEGDYVLDPFVGNGTVMDRAEALNRNSVGIDINDYTEERNEVTEKC